MPRPVAIEARHHLAQRLLVEDQQASLPSTSRRMRTSPLPVAWSASQLTPASRSLQALPRASSTAAAAAQPRHPLRRPPARRGALATGV